MSDIITKNTQADAVVVDRYCDLLLGIKKIHTMLNAMDGLGDISQKSVVGFFYLMYDDASKSINIPKNEQIAFEREYQDFLLSDVTEQEFKEMSEEQIRDAIQQSLEQDDQDENEESEVDYYNNSCVSYKTARRLHLRSLIMKLGVRSECIEEIMNVQKAGMMQNKKIYDHFKQVLKGKLADKLFSFSQISSQRFFIKGRVKFMEEKRFFDPQKKHQIQENPQFGQNNAKMHSMQNERHQERQNSFGGGFKMSHVDKLKHQREEQRNPEKSQEEKPKQKAVCGCGLSVCIRDKLQQEFPQAKVRGV